MLATTADLERYLRMSGQKFSIGSGVRDNITTTDANQYIEDALYEVKNWYEDDVALENLPDDSWIKRQLIKLQCYLVLRSITIIYNGDEARLNVLNSEINRMRMEIEKKVGSAVSLKGGFSEPRF